MGHIDFDHPDETRTFPNGRWDIVHAGSSTIARATMEPGWKWSNDVQPLVGSESCQHRHVGYGVSGRLKLIMDDGSAFTVDAGQTYIIEPGHDAEVVGNEPFIGVEFSQRSAEGYAKKE
ncbi:MAG: cupin domain-containing protein [Thermomicrobiales bacterium]